MLTLSDTHLSGEWVKCQDQGRDHHEQGAGPPGRHHHGPHPPLCRAHRRRGQE